MTVVPRLVALDLPIGEYLVREVLQAWENGDVVLPLDQRMMPAVRRRLAVHLGAEMVVTAEGHETLATDETVFRVPLVSDDAAVIATSGSTGIPKGVIHTHTSLNAHADMVRERLGLAANDHWWLCLPAAHIGGFGVLTRAMRCGSRLSFGNHPDEESMRKALASGATHTAIVPTLAARSSLEGWRIVLVGGSRSGRLPENAISTYGLTESCGGVVYDGHALPGVQYTIRHGEVLLKTPSIARSYRHAPIPQDEGWLATGDLGRIENGLLHIEGRKDDLIITGGNKVWPSVVEQRLREHPLVRDVVVRGITDSEWGSIIRAYVVPQASTAVPTLESLRGHVKETLASYCAPRQLVILGTIPRTALGKVIFEELPQ